MKWKILAASLLFILLGVGVFWEPLFGMALKNGVKKYCRHHFHSQIQIDSVYKKDGYWVLEKPVIMRKDARLLADRVKVRIDPHFLKRSLDLDLVVENSEIDLGEGLSNLGSVIQKILSRSIPFWMFHLNSQFTIDDGVVSWRDDSQSRSAAFQLSLQSTDKQKSGHFRLALDRNELETSSFALDLSQVDDAPIQGFLVCQEVDCAKVAGMYEAMGHVLNGWEIGSGKLNGKVNFVFPEGGQPYAWGKASLKELSCHHPILKISGEVSEVSLDLETDRTLSQVPPIFGKVEIVDGGAMTFFRGGKPYWEVYNLFGGVYFLPKDGIKIDIQAFCQHLEHIFHLTLGGGAQFYDEGQASLDLALRIGESGVKEEAVVQVTARQLGASYSCAELILENIGREEFAFLQTALSRSFPDLQGLSMKNGLVNASGIGYLHGYRLTDLKIDHIVANNLDFSWDLADFEFSVDEITGGLSVNLASADVVDTIGGTFSVSRGRLAFEGLNGKRWEFRDISTKLSVDQGVMQKSVMKGDFVGLHGTLAVDWYGEEAMKLNFHGPAENIVNLIPEVFERGVKKSFSGDNVALSAAMQWIDRGGKVVGVLQVGPGEETHEEQIGFGFVIEQKPETFWRGEMNHTQGQLFWSQSGLATLLSVLPSIASPAVLAEANWIQSESGIAGFIVKDGWFRAEELSLEKYVTPFVFPRKEMVLSGEGTFWGVFDHSKMALEYEIEDMVLDNDLVVVEVEKIASKMGNTTTGKKYAAHYIDLAKGTHFGSLPLENAIFFDKRSGLLFTQTNSYITFVGQEIHLSDVETFCSGLVFTGDIDLNFNKPGDGVFDVVMTSNSIEGKFSQLQNFYSHFDQSLPWLKAPLEGDIAYGKRGAVVKLSFTPEDFTVEADIDGQLSHGVAFFEKPGFAVHDLKFDCRYHHTQGLIDFSKIHGLVTFDHSQGDDFVLSGDHIRFDDFREHVGSFDIWFGDRQRDIVRFVGDARPVDESGASLIEVTLDEKLSHISDIYPRELSLTLKDWMTVNKFHLSAEFNLDQVLADYLQIHYPVDRHFYGGTGQINMTMSYDDMLQNFSYLIEGDDLVVGSYSCLHGVVEGVKHDNIWDFSRIDFDQLHVRGRVKEGEKCWELTPLNVNYEGLVSLEISGSVPKGEIALMGKLSYVDIDMSQLDRFPRLITFEEGTNPVGHLKGKGDVIVEATKGGPGWRVEAILNTSLLDWGAKGLSFDDADDVSCHFCSDKGVTFRRIHTHLLDPTGKQRMARLDIEKSDFDFGHDNIEHDKIYFSIPAYNLSWVSDALVRSFPKFFSPGTAELMKGLKKEGVFEGNFHFEMTSPYVAMHLSLCDGHYSVLGSDCELKNFSLNYDPFEFSLVTQYTLGGHPLWLYGQSSSPTLETGELIISERGPEEVLESGEDQALFVHVKRDEKGEIGIDSVKGACSGLTCFLESSNRMGSSSTNFFHGEVVVDLPKANLFFPDAFVAKVADWQLGRSYHFKGDWELLNQVNRPFSDRLSFRGAMRAENFAFKGYEFETLSAEVIYDPRRVDIKNLMVQDPSGEFSFESMELNKNELDQWFFTMPKFIGKNFRPSLLKGVGEARASSRKPFVIKALQIEGCEGCLADSQSVNGYGRLYFTNKSKKLLQNTIFQLPADIISRIGLDPSVMTPVTGHLEFAVQGDRFVLKKFKDIFSDGKLSKFQLVQGATPSYIDFDGNVNVLVRMRQYNLLFKFAEFFTVNVQGTLQKPSYSLVSGSR